jgi:hypothetical protein
MKIAIKTKLHTRRDRLIKIWLPVFNEQQDLEGDSDMCLTYEQAIRSDHFRCWVNEWSDTGSRGELAELLEVKS